MNVRYLKFVLCLLLVATFAPSSIGAGRDDVYLAGYRFNDGPSYDYYVPWKSLPAKKSWNADSDRFPTNLRFESERSRNLVIREKQRTNQIKLSSIRIKRLSFELGNEISSTAFPQNLSNQWHITFHFDEWKFPQSWRHNVVMLLDGTYGTELTNSLGKHLALYRPQPISSNLYDRPTEEMLLPRRSADSSETLVWNGLLSRSDFIPPSIQWNPQRDEFPFDLRAATVRGKEVLAKDWGIDEALCLDEIEIHGYTPTEAIKARGEDIRNHMHHWYFDINYGAVADGTKLEYSVHMLLDGRVFQASLQSRNLKTSKP